MFYHVWITIGHLTLLLYPQAKMTAEGGPVKPMSAYFLFCRKQRPKMAKKHPEMRVTELTALLAKRYAALPPDKKEKYKTKASAAMTEYKSALVEFKRNHRGLEHTPPEKPPSARDIYLQKHRDVPRPEATAAFRQLSLGERGRYQRKAQRAMDKYRKAVEAYKEQHPGWEPPAVRKSEVDSKPKRLRRAYDIFLKEVVADPSVPPKDRLAHTGERWRTMDEKAKRKYQQIADQENAVFMEYVATLPEEEQAKMLPTAKPKTKKPKRITAKQLFLQEKMPRDFAALTEAEWHRILSKKFAKLSQQDKVSLNCVFRAI